MCFCSCARQKNGLFRVSRNSNWRQAEKMSRGNNNFFAKFESCLGYGYDIGVYFFRGKRRHQCYVLCTILNNTQTYIKYTKNQTNHNLIIHERKMPKISTSTVTPTTALQLWKQEGSCKNHNGNHDNDCFDCNNPRVAMPPNVPILLSSLSLSSSYHDLKDENKKQWSELKGRNGIIEISGEAGSGKTQLCLSLCLNTIMIKAHNTASNPIAIVNTSTCSSITQQHHPNVNKRPYSLISNKHHDTTMTKTVVVYHALYICLGETTTTSQIAHRLHQMVRERIQLQVHPLQDRSISLEEYIQDIMQRIHIKCIHNTEDFISFVQKELEIMLSVPRETNHSSIGLVVLDSIAGLYRIPEEEEKQNFGSKYYVQRSETFFDVASKLKYLSDTYGVHMVVVNQVTGKGNGKHIPSLGLSWSHCVNERYHLSRKERISTTATNHRSNTTEKEGNGDNENPTIPKVLFERKISLIASSKRNINVSTQFRISTAGVYECS